MKKHLLLQLEKMRLVLGSNIDEIKGLVEAYKSIGLLIKSELGNTEKDALEKVQQQIHTSIDSLVKETDNLYELYKAMVESL